METASAIVAPSPNLLEHGPPLGTGAGPALGDLVVVAQVRHEDLVLVHDLVVGPDVGEVGALGGGTGGEVVGGLYRFHGVLRVAHPLDEGFRVVDSGFIPVVEDAEAPDAALEGGSAALRGEAHEDDLFTVGGEARAGVGLVGVELLGNVPAVN